MKIYPYIVIIRLVDAHDDLMRTLYYSRSYGNSEKLDNLIRYQAKRFSTYFSLAEILGLIHVH